MNPLGVALERRSCACHFISPFARSCSSKLPSIFGGFSLAFLRFLSSPASDLSFIYFSIYPWLSFCQPPSSFHSSIHLLIICPRRQHAGGGLTEKQHMRSGPTFFGRYCRCTTSGDLQKRKYLLCLRKYCHIKGIF